MRKHLERLKAAPLMAYRAEDLREATTVIELGKGKEVFERAVEACMTYRIFPENILLGFTEWESGARPMRVGDTIVQVVHIPPIVCLSLRLLFGVRILSLIDEADRKGFSYGTLAGHVEKGISTFTVERSSDVVLFRIHTLSAPGTRLTQLVGPIMARPYQAYCTRRALEHVKDGARS